MRCSVVGTIATDSHGHLKIRLPWPERARSTAPRRVQTKYSLGFAPMKPQRLSFSGSSTGLPLRQPF
jgi:hypothetical protein